MNATGKAIKLNINCVDERQRIYAEDELNCDSFGPFPLWPVCKHTKAETGAYHAYC